MRILIAEDDATSRSLLAALLAKNGHEPIETVNGAEAWDKMKAPDAPNLAILDLIMPAMDGLEVVRRIRAMPDGQTPYIIMLTASGEKNDIVRGLDAGANDYLPKPFHAGELRARVEVGRRMVEMGDALSAKIEELHQALDQIKTLRGIVPICANCKKIRDDAGYWQQVEAYVASHTEAEFSHGFCPECLKKLFPDVYEEISKNDSV